MNNTVQQIVEYSPEVCSTPAHDNKPIVAICLEYCQRHKSHMLCRICLNQCNKKNFTMIAKTVAKQQVVDEKFECASHKNQKPIAYCTNVNCPYHHGQLICQMCVDSHSDQSTIKHLDQEITKYNNTTKNQTMKAQSNDIIDQVCRVLKSMSEQIETEKREFIRQIPDKKLPMNDLNLQELQQLISFMQHPEQESLITQVKQFDSDQQLILEILILVNKLAFEKEKFNEGLQENLSKQLQLNSEDIITKREGLLGQIIQKFEVLQLNRQVGTQGDVAVDDQ